ncbi:hypothetical protein PInf_007995 [Phytophthora infestans]|nr:hypothetical protein PInf_007995 [Phytophthora infestans]
MAEELSPNFFVQLATALLTLASAAVEKILKANPATAKQSVVANFPDMGHGWVCCGDIEGWATKEAVKKAWHFATEFIQTVNSL